MALCVSVLAQVTVAEISGCADGGTEAAGPGRCPQASQFGPEEAVVGLNRSGREFSENRVDEIDWS